jgi:hypothetical protein
MVVEGGELPADVVKGAMGNLPLLVSLSYLEAGIEQHGAGDPNREGMPQGENDNNALEQKNLIIRQYTC